MPLFVPFLIGGVIAAVGGLGVKKGAEGVSLARDARNRVDAARERHQRHVRVLESAREHLNARIFELHQVRQLTEREAFERMRGLLARIQRRGRIASMPDLEAMTAPAETVTAFEKRLVDPAGLLRGAFQAVGAASGASAAATAGVSTFATASTGAAISGLSGAAAKSAVLAWLGGGSLATGGGGVAAGTVVLGGIALAPALLVGGLVVASQGERAVTEAVAYEARVDRAVAEIDAMVSVLTRGERRTRELTALIGAMRARADREMDRLEAVVDSFDAQVAEHARRWRRSMMMCGALRELINCRVLDDNGLLDATAEALLERFQTFLATEPKVTA